MKLEEMLAKMAVTRPPIRISKDTTAMVLIDMQVLAAPSHVVAGAVASGISEEDAWEAIRDYEDRFNSAIANAKKLLCACREKGIVPIHIRVQSYSGGARDTGRLHKKLNFFCPPGSEWSAWLPDVAPLPGEIELVKTCSGAVVGTKIDRILRNMGITELFAVGFYTDQCVETTVRDLADCGYDVALVTDATATETSKRKANTIENIVNVYCSGESTEDILKKIRSL
ncbi:MAG: cysteine hydrolase [Clostridiales Family XIII bacterium]|jgi:nicotinamidase-related amidase|nr:cysteine hydrolase [Clostridiales Family XIII bacterium]